MTIEDEFLALSRIELFENLDSVQLKRLIFVSQRYQLKEGEYLFRQGDTTVNPFGIISGEFSVLLSTGEDEINIAVQSAGALIGEMAVISGEPRNASMRANCDSEVVEFDSALFIETVLNDPKTSFQMMKLLSARIVKMHRQLEKLSNEQFHP
jgi:CRP-like cAMP-binding protein